MNRIAKFLSCSYKKEKETLTLRVNFVIQLLHNKDRYDNHLPMIVPQRGSRLFENHNLSFISLSLPFSPF